MRRFTDSAGQTWDVVVGRESWGALYALFVPAGRDTAHSVRQAPLDAAGYDDAQSVLTRMSEDEIGEMLDRSQPKTE